MHGYTTLASAMATQIYIIRSVCFLLEDNVPHWITTAIYSP